MKNVFKQILIIIFVAVAMISCNKKQEKLDIDGQYLTVADFKSYCSGECDVNYEWENAPAKVKGYLSGAGNDSVMNEYFEKGYFYLMDIRNGMFIKVEVTADTGEIFSFLSSVPVTTMLYVSGTVIPVIAEDDDGCFKGSYLSTGSSGSIGTE